jgi:hypothetical protein
MRAMEILAAAVAPAALCIATSFAAAAVSERKRAAILIATSSIAAIGLQAAVVRVDVGWIAAACAIAVAFTLAWGWLERALAWLVGPTLMLAVHGSWPLLLPALEPMAAAGLLILSIVGGVVLGLSVQRVRRQVGFVDLSALSLLVSLALMSGPVLSMGWRRAAIAGEGQDPVIAGPLLLWPLIVAAGAFAAGIGWKLFTASRGLK